MQKQNFIDRFIESGIDRRFVSIRPIFHSKDADAYCYVSDIAFVHIPGLLVISFHGVDLSANDGEVLQALLELSDTASDDGTFSFTPEAVFKILRECGVEPGEKKFFRLTQSLLRLNYATFTCEELDLANTGKQSRRLRLFDNLSLLANQTGIVCQFNPEIKALFKWLGNSAFEVRS